MNNLHILNYNDNEIRMVIKDGEAWFVAKDVCDVLGLTNVNRAIYKLDDDEKLTLKLLTSGQNRDVATISESGLYALVLRSYNPEAKNFRRWVTHEVLPDIRKHGMYISDKLREAAQVDKKAFDVVVNKYLTEKEKVKALEAQIADDRAFTVVGKTVLSMSGSIPMAEAALFLAQHGINIGRNRLFKWARDKKLLCSQNIFPTFAERNGHTY